MGPSLTETFNTPKLLAELGLRYVLDWTNDDQPYRLNVPGMLSVPYQIELNDLAVFGKGTGVRRRPTRRLADHQRRDRRALPAHQPVIAAAAASGVAM